MNAASAVGLNFSACLNMPTQPRELSQRSDFGIAEKSSFFVHQIVSASKALHSPPACDWIVESMTDRGVVMSDERRYVPGLRLKSLEFVSENEIAFRFEGIDTEDREFNLHLTAAVPLGEESLAYSFRFDDEFSQKYDLVPGPRCSLPL